MREKFTESQNVWLSTTTQLCSNDEKLQSNEKNLRQKESEILFYKKVFEKFKSEVASLLSDDFIKVEANEIDIKEKLSLLMISSKDRGLVNIL